MRAYRKIQATSATLLTPPFATRHRESRHRVSGAAPRFAEGADHVWQYTATINWGDAAPSPTTNHRRARHQ